MFFVSLVIGVLAGLSVPFVSGPLTEFTRSRFELNERDTGIAAFGIVLLVGAMILSVISYASAFWLVLGGILGVFGMRLFTMAQSRTNDVIAARKEDAAKAVETAKDTVEDAVDAASDKVDEVVGKKD